MFYQVLWNPPSVLVDFLNQQSKECLPMPTSDKGQANYICRKLNDESSGEKGSYSVLEIEVEETEQN